MKALNEIAQVGLTVPDLEAAIKWYAEVFGYKLFMPPMHAVAGEGPLGVIDADVFRSKIKASKKAILADGNGTGLELMEFENPTTKDFAPEYSPWKPGYNHFAVVNPNVDNLLERVVANGGKKVSKKWAPFPGVPFELAMVEDPWGNCIEVLSLSADEMALPHK